MSDPEAVFVIVGLVASLLFGGLLGNDVRVDEIKSDKDNFIYCVERTAEIGWCFDTIILE